MYCLKTGFSLVSLAFCLGFVFDANAAPSVRVLGSGAGYSAGTKLPADTNVTAAKTGNTISSSVLGAGSGAKKAASIKSIAPKTATVTAAPRTSSNRPGTTATAKMSTAKTGTERFPGIVTKANVQSVGKVNTVATAGQTATSGGGYNVKEMSDRLNGVEDVLDSKVDASKLSDYYTKDEIDSNYYTAQQVEDRLSNIDASASSEYIRFLTQTINLHSEQIQTLAATDSSIYDTNSGDKHDVYFETTFDADAVLGVEQEADSNEG